MARPIGSTAKLNGKTVRWAGDEYGWQSPASYSKLEKQGQFKLGRKELDALGRYLGPLAQHVADFQQRVRQATPWLDPIERAVNRAMGAEDKLPGSVVARGGAVVSQRTANALNIDPRIGMALPFLVGAVHTSGPRAGTTKLRVRRDISVPHDQLEDAVEAAYQHQNTTGTLRGYDKHIADLPDGRAAVVFNRGNINFSNRDGLTVKVVENRNGTNKPAADPEPVKPAPVTVKSYDPEARFKPLEKESSGLTSGQRRKRDDLAIRNPALPRDLEPSVTTPPVAAGALAVNAQGPAVRGTALAGERYANTHLSESSLPFKVKETQAHHEVPLKDAADYLDGMSDSQVSIARRAAERLQLYFGDTQLNTLYPRQPYHQGNTAWPQAFEQAAHVNLQNPSRPLEAKSGTSRWAQFTPDQKFEMLPEFLKDSADGRRIGQNAVYQQNLLQPGNDAFNNPFGGNFSQAVLAPESIDALKIISDKRRKARQALGN